MRTLVYCGIHDCSSLKGLEKEFDRIYGFDANPVKVQNAKKIFEGDRRFKFIYGALCDKDTGFVEFNITENWDASSSIGTFNPEFPHMKDPDSKLYNTQVRKINVPCLNLVTFLNARVNHVDLLVTDLQGMDLTVLHTLKPWIDAKKITEIRCETEKDSKPQIYEGLSNKMSGFVELLSANYNLIDFITEEDWWEGDTVWMVKE